MFTALKEEVRSRRTMYNKVRSARRSVMDGKVKQAQKFSLFQLLLSTVRVKYVTHVMEAT